jgi:hypothetical protein
MKHFSVAWVLSSLLACSIAMAASYTEQNAALAALPLTARKSPYLVAAFETRSPNISVADFIHYYDNVHVPIIKEVMGPSFPDTHARYYLKRQPDSDTPVIFGGAVADFDYDVITIMTFSSEDQLNEFNTKYMDFTIGSVIMESAARFIITSIVRIVGLEPPHEAHVTSRWYVSLIGVILYVLITGVDSHTTKRVECPFPHLPSIFTNWTGSA